METMRIFIACADEKLRLALLMLLDHQPGMAVVGLSDRMPGLLTQLEGSQPDVLLLNWDITVESMAVLFTDLHALERQPKVIVISTAPQIMETALAAGANYFICKDSPPDKLLTALNEILLSEILKKQEWREIKS